MTKFNCMQIPYVESSEQRLLAEESQRLSSRIVRCGLIHLPVGLIFFGNDYHNSNYGLVTGNSKRGLVIDNDIVEWHYTDFAWGNLTTCGKPDTISSFDFKYYFLRKGISLLSEEDFESKVKSRSADFEDIRNRFNITEILRTTPELQTWLNK